MQGPHSSPAVLEGEHIRLRPLVAADAEALHAAADDPAGLFRYLPDRLQSLEDHRGFVARALAEQQQGRALPFAICALADGAVLGTTRFGAIEPAHARAEIGWTWIRTDAQRTAVNTECKRLLLAQGFEALGLNRIELKTDSLNLRSRAAILRLGATEEGVFRNHMVMPDGRLRHTVYYSIIREEWPQVRCRLDALLGVKPVSAAMPAAVEV